MHERWEKDLVQLQAELLNVDCKACPSSTAELQEPRQRIIELEGLAKRQKEEAERQTSELEQLRCCQANVPQVAAASMATAVIIDSANVMISKRREQIGTVQKNIFEQIGGVFFIINSTSC